MNTTTGIGVSSAVTGTIAGVVSAAVLALLAKAEGKGALQPVNATSHWLHGERAGDVDALDAGHTGVGFATHQASAMFWAAPFEAWLAFRPPQSLPELLRDAGIMATIAAVVDYGIVPKRLTPGWEEVVSKRSIALTYGALALGLAAGAIVSSQLRRATDATYR